MKDDLLNDLLSRGQSLDTELQDLVDRMWTLLQKRKDLQIEYIKQFGDKEVEIGFMMDKETPKITGIKFKEAK